MSEAATKLRKAIHDLSLHGAKSADERHALGLLSYYLTSETTEKLVAAIQSAALTTIREDKP